MTSMLPPLWAVSLPTWVPPVLTALLLSASVTLVGLVLIQRGKGGGLAGAFGGAGGSSAFGSRAGDLFTRITIGVAAAWILMIMIQVKLVQSVGRTVAAPTIDVTSER